MGCCTSDDEKSEAERIKEDVNFQGPMKNRGCTDIICLIIFLAYLGGMVWVFIMAIGHHGDPYRLFYGYDVKGDTCGTRNQKLDIYNESSGEDQRNKTYLYIDLAKTAMALFSKSELEELNLDTDQGVDPIGFCLTGKVKYSSSNASNDVNEVTTQKTKSGLDDKIYGLPGASDVLSGGDSCRYCVENCPDNYDPVFWRCIPRQVSDTVGDTATTFFESSGAKSFFEEVVTDIAGSWREIIYMCLIALGLSIIVTILFRFMAGLIVYIIVALIALAALLAPVFCWYLWYVKKQDFDAKSENGTTTTGTEIEEKIHNATQKFLTKDMTTADSEKEVKNWMIISIVVTIFAVMILLILLVLRKRIKLVVQLFKEAGKAIHSMPLILLQPLLTLLSLVALAAIWTVAITFIETAGEPAKSETTGYIQYKKDSFWFWIRLYHLFGLLWLANFVIACQHVVISGAIAGWYFTRDKSELSLPIASSFWRLIRYHLGSVAFGSFIIALVQLVRMIMQWIERKISKNRGASGALGKVLVPLIKLCQCCLWCFEKFLKFLNRNAYIEVAIYGYNFCKAAQKAFSLLTSNILRVAAINSVGTFVLFLGKVAVVVSTVFIGAEIMQYQVDSGKLEIKHQWPPIILAALFAYMIIDCFIGVYGMAIDTIFLSFCEDSERNDGITKPYFMSVGLMEFVENSSKALEALKKRKEAATKPNQVGVQPQNPNQMTEVTD